MKEVGLLHSTEHCLSHLHRNRRGHRVHFFSILVATLSFAAVPTSAFSVSKSTPSFVTLDKGKMKKKLSLSANDEQNMSMDELAKVMKESASTETPFTEEEINGVISSFQSLLPDNHEDSIDMKKLAALLESVPHLSHKEWDRTGTSSSSLQDILLPPLSTTEDGNLNADFQSVMDRVLNEGNWHGAFEAASKNDKPWAVLVTGVNGIRKTTSIYQPWFKDLLGEALIPPKGTDKTYQEEKDKLILPTGQNSFFRQLDHMITIIANKEFENLYTMTQKLSGESDEDKKEESPSSDVINSYASLKDAIFTRYRTLAEMLGILLLRQASERNMNVMLETSGRDVAMFEYVNKFFSAEKYNKLVLHFTINDIGFAEESVDLRMTDEIKEGLDAIGDTSRDRARKVVYANKGGPYGSEVLKGVQSASDQVWLEKVLIDGGVADSWYKAEIVIEGSKTEDWKAIGVTRGEDNEEIKGKEYTFERRK